MQSSPEYRERELEFTYEEYLNRGKTLENQVIDNRYVVYNRIGEGSNGEVYRGVDKTTKKEIAIKLMDLREINNLSNATVKSIKQRLSESQPRLMFICNSPNLMKCFDVYRSEDLKIMILQYCNGKTLQAEIDQKRRIPEKEAIQIVKHLIIGLMEMHRHKIVHRDLKAENIMSHNGTYKIIDFGFSKKLQIAQQNAEVKGTSLGTITTMAPEVMSRRPYGLKADIWSLGIIFFQMIFGIYPYDSLTAPSLYQQIRTKKLFQNPDPPTINGYTPTRQSYDFFKFLVVFETEERPSWKQVSQYPLIKNQSDEVNQRFIRKVDVVPDEKLEKEFEVGTPINSRLNEQVNERQVQTIEKKKEQVPIEKPFEKEKPKSNLINISERMRQEEQLEKQIQARLQRQKEQKKKLKYLEKTMMKIEAGQKKVEVMKVEANKKMEKGEVKSQLRDLDNQQKLQYQFTQRAHLQCLKTQFIFREIVNPILSTNYISLSERVNVEFIYLLLARCFNNMSPIRDELEKSNTQNRQLIQNLNQQITPLYDQVREKFLEFSNMLTKMENKVTSVIGDFFRKKVKSKEFEEKDRFLTGIEIVNYSKAQQIQYTNRYFKEYIQEKIIKINNLSNVYKRLNKYIAINEITQQQLQYSKKTFASTVTSLL